MSATNPSAPSEVTSSWVPMLAIALGQALMSFNVAALPVSMGGMVRSFDVPPTTIGTGIVLYSLSVAGFVMLGAKLCQRFGAVGVFRVVIALFGLAQILMTFSPVASVMLLAQLLCGLAAAAIVPIAYSTVDMPDSSPASTAIRTMKARNALLISTFLVVHSNPDCRT